MRPTLRLTYHRGTTAHLSTLYPFSVQPAASHRGVYVGVDHLAGGAAFCWDPFEAYADGAVTNPNVWVLGEPGGGKSALVKCLLSRMAAIYGSGDSGRWIAIADPKGEYVALAEHLGLTVLRLAPGGQTRLNPLAPGPAAAHETTEQQTLRRAEMVAALVATVLERPLTQVEDAAIFAATEHLIGGPGIGEPTLADIARLLTDPSDHMLGRLRSPRTDVARDLAPVAYALDKLLTRSLRGMFDGRSTVDPRWHGTGLVLDLSAVPLESDALPLVMVAAAGWLQQLMACPGPNASRSSMKPGRCSPTATPRATSRPASSSAAPTGPPTSPSPTEPPTSAPSPTTDQPPRRSPPDSSPTPPHESSSDKPPTRSPAPSNTSASPHPKPTSSANSPAAGPCGRSPATAPSSNTRSPPTNDPSATPTNA